MALSSRALLRGPLARGPLGGQERPAGASSAPRGPTWPPSLGLVSVRLLCALPRALLTRPWGSGWWHIPAPVGDPEGALGCWSPTSAGHRPQALGPSALLELHFPGSWPKPPASQSCREDQLRPHVIGTGLPQSGVQIGGLRELLLPPDTARGPGRGPGAQRREQSLEGAEHGPPVVLGLPVGRLPGPREGRQVHTAGGPVPGAQAVGGEPRGPEEMQTAPSQSPWPLEPETKDPVTKNSSPQTMASFLQASHDLLGNE